MTANHGVLKAEDESSITFPAIRMHPWKVIVAVTCEVKAPDPRVTQRVVQLVQDCGVLNFVCMSDTEVSIGKVLAEAAALAGIKADEVNDEDPEQEDLDEAPPSTQVPEKHNHVAAPKTTLASKQQAGRPRNSARDKQTRIIAK